MTTVAGAILLSSRPVSWINTAYPFAAAFLLAGAATDPAGVALLAVGAVFFLIPYNLAMYGINDVFDYASDLANPRKGGVEGALLPPRLHRTVLLLAAVTTVPFAVVLAIAGGPATWIALAVTLFAVVAYSAPPLRFKERPGLDSATSSAHFVGPAAVGLALAADRGGSIDLPTAVLTLGAFFSWGMAAHAFGAVQDIEPDRAAGIGSIATALGARRTVRLAVGLWAVAGALLLLAPWPAPLAAPLALPYVALAVPWWRVTDARSAATNRSWRWFLAVNYAVGAAVTVLLLWSALT